MGFVSFVKMPGGKRLGISGDRKLIILLPSQCKENDYFQNLINRGIKITLIKIIVNPETFFKSWKGRNIEKNKS